MVAFTSRCRIVKFASHIALSQYTVYIFQDKKKTKKTSGEGDWKMAKKIMLCALVFLIVVILFFSLLGMTIEIHGKVSGINRIEDGVNAIKNHLNLTDPNGK